MNGSAVQLDDSGTRASISDAPPVPRCRRMPPGVSRDEPARGVEVADEAAASLPPVAVHDTYGVLPKNVMSGWLASCPAGEIGLPPLNSSKWSPPTRRETKIA